MSEISLEEASSEHEEISPEISNLNKTNEFKRNKSSNGNSNNINEAQLFKNYQINKGRIQKRKKYLNDEEISKAPATIEKDIPKIDRKRSCSLQSLNSKNSFESSKIATLDNNLDPNGNIISDKDQTNQDCKKKKRKKYRKNNITNMLGDYWADNLIDIPRSAKKLLLEKNSLHDQIKTNSNEKKSEHEISNEIERNNENFTEKGIQVLSNLEIKHLT